MRIHVRGDFEKWTDEVKAWFKRQFTKAVLHLEANTVVEAPVVTGNLRDSVSNTVAGQSPQMIGTVTVTSKYAPFVAGGTGIYGPRNQKIRITAKSAKALRFVIAGKLLFRKSVESEGMRPNPFHERAAEKSLPKIEDLFQGVEF